MTNKDMFDMANRVNTKEIKELVRTRFSNWCKENNRPLFGATTITDWWKEEWKEEGEF